MIHSGFLYYYDLLGLDRDSLRLHYRFDETSGVNIPNDAPNFPQMSGTLSSVGNFYNKSGSGLFTGQTLTIQNSTGLPSDFWSHIFVFERTGGGKGVIFDSLMQNDIVSGYLIGINDANKLYFESYDQNGPMSKTSSIMLGKKNMVAVVRANNLLTFYCFDFNNDDILSENHSLNGTYVLPASKGVIGRNVSSPSYVQTGRFDGYIDEYVFLQEGITPSTFRYLVSGLCSDYIVSTGDITLISGVEITGYATGITGVTGVTGFENQVTGSGIDPFGTGEYELFWGTVPLTGYIVSGYGITALTGTVVRSVTGDPFTSVVLRSGYVRDFNLDEVSYIRQVDIDDISLLNIYPFWSTQLNLQAGYDFVLGQFQLDSIYETSQIEVYLNGIAQLDTGFAVTGNFYGSGVVLSGDYRLDGFYLDTTGFFGENDIILYDRISGARQRVYVTGAQSGATESLTPTGQFIYFNGQLMLSGIDYSTGVSGLYRWTTSKYDGVTGALITFPIIPVNESITGELLDALTGIVPRRNSQLFLNGQRQLINKDYIENSAFDLINQSGIFETSLTLLYNDDENFFEDFAGVSVILTADLTIFTADTILITADMTHT